MYREVHQEQLKQVQRFANRATLNAALGLLEWNTEQVEAFYDNVYNKGLIETHCNIDDKVSIFESL